MADIPTSGLPQPKSYEQINSDMLSTYASRLGINDFNVGSAVTTFFSTVALAVARASGDVFQILRDFSVDRAKGDALKRLALENNVTPITAKVSSGLVTIIDTSFTKKSTKVYAGANPPNIGSTAIKVSDTTGWTASGSVYIGRGTPNIEGPIPYTSITPSGSYFIINLSAPTTKFHNVGESVILAQGGNRNIPVNTLVISPAVGSSPDIQYTVTAAAVILDGEVEVDNVQITALNPGAAGNAPRGAIKVLPTPPFSGATVTNALPFTTGRDSETDDELRVRIKNAIASRGLGTATAVKAAVIGATPSDEQSTIVSSDLVLNSDGAVLFVDDGTGYEAKTAGVGLESIVDSALGGEQFFQLATGGRQAPVAKAFLQSTLSAPFDLIGGDTLAITVGEQTYQHTFSNTDFRSPGGATAYEVSASVNADTSLGFEATTAGGGQFAVFRAKANTNDTLKIATPTTSGRDAAAQMGLPSNEVQTLRPYKNKIPLSKDGRSASLFTQEQSLWSPAISNGDTLILSVDGTAAITYTINDADFIATGLYTSVSATNSLDSWVEVFNNKLTGVTAAVVGQQIKLSSNLGTANRAKIVIDGSSTLVNKGMFSSLLGLSSQGKTSDFTLDRNTAQFELAVPLVLGDKLEIGTDQTEARVESAAIPAGSIAFSADAHTWILIDAAGALVPTGVAGNTVLNVSKPATNTVRYTSAVANAFSTVQVGDYVIIWSAELSAGNRLEGRVNAVTSTTLDIIVTASEYASAVVESGILFSDGFVVLRSVLAPQKFKVSSGNLTLDQIAQVLQAQTEELSFSVLEEEFLVVMSKTKNTSGSLFIVTSDAQGKLLNLQAGSSDTSKDSLISFYDSQEQEGELPLFVHSAFSSDAFANPPDSFVTSVNTAVSLASRDPNELISPLHPYGAIKDAQPYGELTQIDDISGSTLDLASEPVIRRLRVNDRFFLANPLDFGSADTAVIVVDGDTTSKSFEVPFYRRAITNITVVNNPNNFNAYDVDSGPSTIFASNFGSFDFSNFKVMMQAKKVLKHQASQTAILYRSAKWGRSGEKITVGYVYPGGPNAAIASSVEIDSTVDIRISLQSGATVNSSIDGTTEWNVTIVSNNPVAGVDQVTYTWNGTGTAPALTLVGGEYVNIGNLTEFSPANTGIFRVSTQAGFTPTATSFTVQRPTGVAVAESNKSTLVSGQINFYQSSATTAAAIQAYVAANLADYFSATLVNDGGVSGNGVIQFSTFEDSNFTYNSVQLKDGINWIASSNLGGSPNFTFKRPLALSSDVGYAFNNSEEVRLVPTTQDQVMRLISVLAVTGLTTVATVNLAERGSRLEIATDTLGSDGSIQIIGGLGNDYQVPVLDSAIRLDNQLALVSMDKISSQGVHSDQWFKLTASTQQRKDALFNSNTSITLVGNSPSVGKSTVKLLGRTLTQRYFGKPRHHLRTRGLTFRVEKQGALVCISWNGIGGNPQFIKTSLNFNDSGGGTLNVAKVSGTNDAQVTILSGNANFNELSIGDLVTISGLPVAANNGTFLVTGVSDDGLNMRVLNSAAVNEFSFGTFTFTGNSTAGDTFTVGVSNLVAGTNFAIGATQTDTAANLAAVIGTLPNVTASANGSVVTVTATLPSANIALAYSGTPVVTVSGSALAGQPFSAGQFTASSEVSEGDNIILSSPFSVLNQGKFRVIRRYNNSVWIENPDVIEEEVTLVDNLISLGFDATTSFKVNATNHTQYVNWNGVGTEPHLENAKMGDVVRFGTNFSSGNQGDFMVLRNGVKLQQITQFTCPTGAQFSIGGAGKYFFMNSAGNITNYYVWFNVNGSNSDPAPGGTGIQVAILSGDSASNVAAKLALAVNGFSADFSASSNGSVATVTTTGYIETNDASNFNVPAPFSILVTQEGRRTFIECVNPSAVNQGTVFVTGTLECHRPQMQFEEYEATVAGDKFVITGNVLGSTNAGSYIIDSVIDRDTAVVIGTLASQIGTSLLGFETAVYVQEEKVYTGYKHILLVALQPGAATRNVAVFDTNAQSEKINESASVQMDSLNKLNFSTLIKNGLDSYRYNTGLIAEANRIIYGDARDSETYPGVGAAGADIFIREPLTRRVTTSINVRLQTGVPFAQIAEQVRTNVSSLINSNGIGQSIAISAIVATVESIPGIISVTISSPQYDTTHDVITIASGEKARIIDPSLDISVSQIGS
jgi:uncharacterized phage protein gp47/JayE